MKITGIQTLDAPPDHIWPLIFDPAALLELLPGCEQIEQVATDEYRGRMILRVPALAGTYETSVKILERRAPSFCRMQGQARGPGGSVSGQAAFTLTPAGAGTSIQYDGDAQVSGPLAGINPRFTEGVAQTLIRQGLSRLPELAAAFAAEGAAEAPARPSGRERLLAFFRSLGLRLRALFRHLPGSTRKVGS